MRALLVVVVAEDVELQLQVDERLGNRLLGQVPLEGLVETFDLAACTDPYLSEDGRLLEPA